LLDREAAVTDQEAAGARERAELDVRSARLRSVEQREAALADRATVLDAREVELSETIGGLEQRERELAQLRATLDEERGGLVARSRRLVEAERRAPVRRYGSRAVGFSEGLKELARKRGAAQS